MASYEYMRDWKKRNPEKVKSYVIPKTHCPRGHEYTPGNTILAKGHSLGRSPKKMCRQCKAVNHPYWREGQDQGLAMKRFWLNKKFSITHEQYLSMLRAQDGKCLICLEPFGKTLTMKPAVDHDHKTGRIRGLLHGKCNMALGTFGDDADVCFRAAMYLSGAKEEMTDEEEIMEADTASWG